MEIFGIRKEIPRFWGLTWRSLHSQHLPALTGTHSQGPESFTFIGSAGNLSLVLRSCNERSVGYLLWLHIRFILCHTLRQCSRKKTTSVPLKFHSSGEEKKCSCGRVYGLWFFPPGSHLTLHLSQSLWREVFSPPILWLCDCRICMDGRQGVFPAAHSLVFMLLILQTNVPKSSR